MIARRLFNLIWSQIIPSRIRNSHSRGIWASHLMFQDWFGLHRDERDRLESFSKPSTQMKPGGIRDWRKCSTECVDVSPASLCILTTCFSWRNIMGEWSAVPCDHRLISRCIAAAIKRLARPINFSPVRANSARMLLCSALPLGPVSIWQKDY